MPSDETNVKLRLLIFAITILGCINNTSDSEVVEGTQQQKEVQFLPAGLVDGVCRGWIPLFVRGI